MAAKGTRQRSNIIATVLIVAVVAAGLAIWGVMGASAKSASCGLYAIVHDGDGNETELPLDVETQYVAETSLGYNTVVVEGGSVCVVDADCANHDCVKQGEIDTPGQQIVCLPHKLWIEVVAADSDGSAGNSSGDASIDVESR